VTPQRIVVAATLLAASFCAGAQTLKPGLWELSNKMQSSSGQAEQSMAKMQQQMASMPPEQRKMMEDMMAKQGVSMGAGGPGGMSLKVCMTKEMVERNDIPAQQGDCKHVTSPRSGNTMRMSFTCSNPPSSGEGTITFVSPEAYTMKMTVQTAVQGKPEKMSMDGSGKWLSADCGAIKPMAVPRK
jgi:hypothetical protein